MQNLVDSLISLEAEKNLLACALFSIDAREEILAAVTSKDFHEHTFRIIFHELEKIKAEGLLGDYFLVADRLQKQNITLSFIEKIMSHASYDMVIPEWIARVKQFSAARISYTETQVYLKNICEDPTSIADERDNHIKQQLELPIVTKSKSKTLDKYIKNFKDGKSYELHIKESMELRKQNKLPMQGLSWGYINLDNMTSGINVGHLIIIGARPAVGKTTFSLNICSSLILKQIPVLFISLEMTGEAILAKIACNLTNISMKKIEDGLLYEDQYARICKCLKALENAPLYLIDTTIYINDLLAIVKEHVRNHGIEVVFVDYLGLIKNRQKFDSKTNEISYLTRELKGLAKETSTSVICLSQLSRASEKEGRRPNKSDLRDSGQIEADADLVFLLHQDTKQDDNMAIKPFEVIVEKNRFGPTGIVLFDFDKESGKITERKLQK